MFFDLPSLRRWALRSLATGALLVSVVVLTPGCGHKKSPIPPPSKVPQKVTLLAHQRGHEAVVSFPFPTTTISGTLLPGIAKIEVWQYSLEVPEFAIELLAQEAEARKEAQALLDELGLPLVETPLPINAVVDPVTGALIDPVTGAPIDPAAGMGSGLPTGAPTVEPTTDGATPASDPVGATSTGSTTPPAPPAEPAEPAMPEEIADDAAAVVVDLAQAVEAAEEAISENAPGEEDGELVSDAGEGTGEGEESALTEEEQLELRVKAARGLLLSPPTPKSSFISATSKDFKKDSELVLSIEGEDVQGALVGDKIVLRLPLPPRPSEGPEIGYIFAAKVFALNGKPSDFSAMQAILPSATPPAPKDVTVEAQADGVYLKWAADEDPEDGFRIYRRDAQTRLYGEPAATLTLGTERFYLDRQAVYGARYIYGLTAVETAMPLLESDLSSEHEIDFQDQFGPSIPGGLVAFPEAGRVRLLWTTVPNLDVAGYEVSRRAAGETTPTPITRELVTRGQYLDEAVASGDVWLYSVVAVDTSGNRSMPSAETEVRVP